MKKFPGHISQLPTYECGNSCGEIIYKGESEAYLVNGQMVCRICWLHSDALPK